MGKTFTRTLVVMAIIQFVVTRMLAGQAIEEGRAERMWMLYPLNVLLNALAWTLLISGTGRVLRIFRHAS